MRAERTPTRMDLAAAVEAHQRELAGRWTKLQGGYVVDREDLLLTVAGSPVPFTNGVHSARLEPDGVDAAIADAVAVFRRYRVPAIWWVGPGTRPKDLGRYLELAGFSLDYVMPWMWAHASSVEPPDVAGLEIRRVASAQAQAEWVAVMVEGMPLDEDETRAMTSLADVVGHAEDAGWQRFVGRLDGEAVGTSAVMLAAGLAGIYSVATIPAARGRGVGAAMTEAAVRRGAELGHHTAILGSSARAVPLYERLGFRHVCDVMEYLWPGGEGR